MARFTNLGDLIVRERDLDKVAVIDLGGEQVQREFTYAQLDAMSNAVARALLARGRMRGERVAILSANRAEYLAAYFGIMRAGLVAVPVNFKFPRQTIHFIMQDADARFVFCDRARRADCPAGLPVVVFGGDGPESFDAFLDPGPFDAIVPTPNEPCMFLYTSGSTGTPKGVVLSHQSHIWVVEARLAPGLDRHRYLIAAPLYHMNALALSLLACAAHATNVLLPQFTARGYIEAIERYRITWLTAVPPMVAMMLREKDLLARTDLSSVAFIRMGSAPVSASLMESIHHTLPHAAVTNAYGTTEAGPVVFGPHPQGLPQPEMSVGYPHPKVALRLVDGDNNCDAKQGVLEMKCPAMMNGYHNRPDVRPPFTDDGYYVTGDVFRRDENDFYYFVGRTDDMFVSGGENIYPADVERMLERHPDVAQAAVVPIEDDIKGQKPVAFVIPKAGRAPSEDDIKRFALANAPAYQHPRHVWFVDDLPLASTNKVDRAALHREAEKRLRMS
jgi:acyl-CoA synthetase (AMP-forming)/AMP-acid ligase II